MSEELEEKAGLTIASFPAEYYKHIVHLTGEICEPSRYTHMLELCHAAGEIIGAMGFSQARIIGVLNGHAASAATAIFLNCDDFIVGENASFMIHSWAFGGYGTTRNVHAQTNFWTKQADDWLDRTYKGFLSDDEIRGVKDGKEIWLEANDLRQRLENLVKTRESQENE